MTDVDDDYAFTFKNEAKQSEEKIIKRRIPNRTASIGVKAE